MKEWEVWLKGDVPEGQGHSGVCDIIEHQLMGSATAETFEEAVAIVGAAYLERHPDMTGYYDVKALTFWGYPLQPEKPI